MSTTLPETTILFAPYVIRHCRSPEKFVMVENPIKGMVIYNSELERGPAKLKAKTL